MGSKEQAKEAMISKLNMETEREAEKVGLIEFVGRNIVNQVLTKSRKPHENSSHA